jgi:thioredoxin 1
MSKEIINATNETFSTIINETEGLVLVDFWAEWCGPCKMITPILEQAAEEGKVQVVKVDVDNEQEVAAKFGIRGIPTLMLFKKGVKVGTKVGALSKSSLDDFISENL